MADIVFERGEGVARATLNRPAVRNAITAEMVGELHDFLLSLESDRSIRCVLLSGAGGHFMAGGDVKSFAESVDLPPEARRQLFRARVQAVAPLLLTMQRLPQVLVTAVCGACAGAGVSWVAASDVSIAARSSFFVLAQVGIGVSPDGSGTWWLPRTVGLKRAKEIALLGERFGAAEAERWGLLNRVVDDAQFVAEVEKLVSRLGSGPALALARTKQLLNESSGSTLAQQLDAEADSFADCTADPDFIEGAVAFTQKRRPHFGSGS
jgi:2-(1,2-epoxy-1,2-dihydrophenyl)acetyl-CoA isomerase